MSIIDQHAEARAQLHASHSSSRPLSEGYENVGLAGEHAFSQATGIAMDLEMRPGGDGGKDFEVFLGFTVNVHTARKAYNLIHEVGSKTADIIVLAAYSDETKEAELIGWEWGTVVLAAPSREFGHGILNHYIAAERLRPMKTLFDRLGRITCES